MKVEAVKGFSGFLNGKSFNMHAGEVREVEDDNETIQELISIGYLMRTFPAEPENTENTEGTPNAPEPDEVKPDEDKRGKSKRG